MPLLEAGNAVPDSWIKVGDEDALPDSAPALITLDRFQREKDALAGRNAPLGVLLPSDAKPESIADSLDRISLVAIQFPVFKDGRGFTIARTLRERYGYKGEIRAVGHVLIDQHVFLLRCGFTTVEIPEVAKAAEWKQALGQYDIAYQGSMMDDEPLSLFRRHVAASDLTKTK